MDNEHESIETQPNGDSVSAQEEAEIRARVRDRLRVREVDEHAQQEVRKQERERQAEIERLRWQVIEEETEEFHRERGRKKYISSNGEVKWLTPDEFEARRARRSRLRAKSRRSRRWRIRDLLGAQLRAAVVSFAISLLILLLITITIFAVEFA